MDIVTHTMAGMILASPLVATAPVTATCVVVGSVLPDLDALSRCFGKVAFLRCHQTYTHSLLAIPLTSGLTWLLLRLLGVDAPFAPLALGAAMLLHSLMDVSNTYGVALLSPFSSKRYCVEWVFFIDSIVITASLAALVAIAHSWQRSNPFQYAFPFLLPASLYAIFLGLYWGVKWRLRRRAWKQCPADTVSLIPSALYPWSFFGYALGEDRARLFRLNTIRGDIAAESQHTIFDAQYSDRLDDVKEFHLMKGLSPAYHITSVTEENDLTRLVCQDLRVRNFGGKFGELELAFGREGNLERKVFHA